MSFLELKIILIPKYKSIQH